MSSIQDYVIKFNNGEWDEFSQIFNDDANNFLSLIKRRGFLFEIDLKSLYDNDEYLFNPTLKMMLEVDPSYLTKVVQDYLHDVIIRPDGYYLKLRDQEELSEFFKDNQYSREYNDRDVVKSVMGEDWWEPYSDTVHDLYDDIIKELNDKNIQALASRILEICGNQELSLDDYHSDLFEELSDEDRNFIITESNIRDIINDEDSMKSLFKDILNDIYHQLHNMGVNAYNQAYTDKVYKIIWSELSTLFEGKIEWESRKLENNPKTLHIPFVKIRDLYGDVMGFLDDFNGYGDTFIDYDGYTSMKTHWMDQNDEFLTIRIPDYPDSDEVVTNINDIFADYLH
jgi:hypothetical protein